MQTCSVFQKPALSLLGIRVVPYQKFLELDRRAMKLDYREFGL
ncbi:MAG: hypothetical protein ACI83E_002184 [Sulfitobacter sp.]|jgi:hypothetical protein